ncbi:MAG: uroporphyrinogen-III synthase [Cognaticolwellia sp.]
MNKHKLKLLITRPEKAGRDLQLCLQQQGYQSYCQPLFDYQPRASHQQLLALQAQVSRPIIIFISVAAVEFANKLMPISAWPKQAVVAVGRATQQALQALNVRALVPKTHDSEGLLALSSLHDVQQKDVIIVRGDGGRELIADDLRQRGASVHYFESYQRVWRSHSVEHVKTWQQQQINCILITSNALLEFIVNLIRDTDSYWQDECLWIVASERIANNAKQLGIKRIINANGASTKAIMATLTDK